MSLAQKPSLSLAPAKEKAEAMWPCAVNCWWWTACCCFSCCAADVGLAGLCVCRLLKIGVSGVGGKPVQLASEEAELDDEEVDSTECLRCRVAAVKACRGVRGDWTLSGGGECFAVDRVVCSYCCLGVLLTKRFGLGDRCRC